MGPAVALAIVLVVVVVAIRVLHRRRRDEIRSIHHYHDRLDTLHVEQHDRGGSVRLVHGDVEAAEHHEPDRPRLDPDAAHIDTAARSARPEPRRGRHDREWALERMQPRARVDTATALVVAIVVAVLVAIALAGYLIQRGRGSTTTTTTTTLPSTSTTAAQSAYTPRSMKGQIAVYTLPAGTYAVTVTGLGGAVWASATSPISSTHPDGRLVAQGASSTFTFSRGARVLLGAPGSASVTVNGIPVVFPSPVPAPLTLQFSAPR